LEQFRNSKRGGKYGSSGGTEAEVSIRAKHNAAETGAIDPFARSGQ
jgi:hypothetical protein